MTITEAIEATAELRSKLARNREAVAARREQAIATLVESTTRATAQHLAADVNEVAEAEGEKLVYARVAQVVDYHVDRGDDTAVVTAEVLAMLLQLADTEVDDTWSGRTNDARRARYDGVRKGIAKVQRMLP